MADNLFKETFSHVRSSYEFSMEDFEKTEENETVRPRRRFSVGKLLLVAAVAVMLTALGVTASATGFFGLTEPAPPTEAAAPEEPREPAGPTLPDLEPEPAELIPTVTFGAGVELLEENIIAEQSFGIILAGLGRVRFISYAPTEEFPDVRFFFTEDGNVSLSELTPVLTGLTFEQVAAVSFEDMTGDGFADIFLLIDYRDTNGDVLRRARLFAAEGDGSFRLETRISRLIEAGIDNSRLNVPEVRAWLRPVDLTELLGGARDYAGVLADNLNKYGDTYFTRYTVLDLTGDGAPELIAGEGTCEADALWAVWTMEEGEARLLGTFGAGHTVLYERDGELVRLMGQMGVEVIDRIYWDGEKLVEETLSTRQLGPLDEYARPGRELPTAEAGDPSLIWPVTY